MTTDSIKLLTLLGEYKQFGDDTVRDNIIDLANRVLINSAGYSYVEEIYLLQQNSYLVMTQQLVGEPDPKVRGVISCDHFNIPYGAVMTPCQKQLAKLLDGLDDMLIEQPVATDARIEIHSDLISWSNAFILARAKVVQLAKSIFFEASIKKVRFGDLVIFCKEAGLSLRSSESTTEMSYFVISSDAFELRVERQWA